VRDSEIDQRNAVVVAQHDVARLQVSMDDAGRVDDRKCARDFPGIAQSVARRQFSVELRA
jgi:hypothetical protein